MNQSQASRILEIMARMEPGYEAFAAEYGPALAGAEVPDDFAIQTLNLLRADPKAAAQIALYERNLSQVQTFGLAEVSATVSLIAAVLLILRPDFDFHTEWDWKVLKGGVRIKTNLSDEKALNAVLKVLSSAMKKASKTLTDVANVLDGQNKDDSSDN